MFTGIVKSIGTVREFTRQGGGARLVVETALADTDLQLGDSIAVDGCCQTIAEYNGTCCVFHALEETLRRTRFGCYQAGSKVNIEPALRAGDRLGGHIVQGHVDCVGKIVSISSRGSDIAVKITRPDRNDFPMVHKGSVAVNGISLTIAELAEDTFTICIIPHTWSHTALQWLKEGAPVNLEADIIGKYVAELLRPAAKSSVTMETLLNAGF